VSDQELDKAMAELVDLQAHVDIESLDGDSL
jgi:hypothetical protein